MSASSSEDSWLRAALEGADLAAWVWDVTSDEVRLTDAWSDIIGEPRRETVMKRNDLAALVHPDDLPRLVTLLDSVRRGRTSAYDVEHRVRTTSGSFRWILSKGKVTERDADGKPLRVTGTNADITARRRAEEMLAAREIQLRVVSDGVPAMIVELDANDRIRYCNSRYAALSGKAPETLVGQSLTEAMDRGAQEHFSARHAEIHAGRPVTYERVLARPGHPEMRLLVQVMPRLERGREYAGCTVLIEDITERTRLARMKEEFINTVSHELRTPLGAIRASLALIAESAAPEQTAQLVRTARESCERLVRLVNDVLDYQRLRAGQLPPALTGLDLAKQVREAVTANEILAREAGVTLEVHASDEALMVPANPDRVTQLVTNLLANALKHSSRGDTIDLIVARGDGCARVSVRDRGPGVPVDFQPQLFQQFSQAQAADGKKRGGTGLGLAICKAIAEQMRGRIGYEPAEGKGSVFWFELPLK